MDAWPKTFVERYGGKCPVCRTPLRPDLATCPHCRQPWRLGLKVLESYLLAWGTAAGATALQAGFGLFILYLTLRRPGPARATLAFLGIGCWGVVTTLGLLLLLSFRRRFCATPRWTQWLLAAGMLSTLVIITALFSAYVY